MTEVTIQTQPPAVVTIQARNRVVEIAARGLPGPIGPQGEPGDSIFTLLAPGGSAISALRAVVAEGGVARYPDINDPLDAARVVGISLTAAGPGEEITVRYAGAMDDEWWTWQPGAVWCGAAGVLTQTLPQSPAWLMEVGRSTSATNILIDIQRPIIR